MPESGLEINELVVRAQAGDTQAREHLLANLKSYAGRIAARLTGRTLAWENDDELGVALCALNEAVDSFDPQAGARFETFAAQVIRRRLIDYVRRENRHRGMASSLDEMGLEPVSPAPAENIDLSLAVEALKTVLARYGLDFSSLVSASPKHRDTREALIRAALTVAGDKEMLDTLDTQRRLPLNRLMEATGLSRRVLERGRRYVVAVVLILTRKELYPLRSFAGLNKSRITQEGR